ncbi:MAG: hypothetical protein JEZ03_02545 [Bacteroidales bacterium]|nr:hypothetical protein [Bacteroidales bacterium]
MKYSIIIIISLMLFSCSKTEEKQEEVIEYDINTIEKNGVNLEAVCQCKLKGLNKDTIYFSFYIQDDNGYNTDGISLVDVPFDKSRVSLNQFHPTNVGNPSILYFHLIGDDAIDGIYNLIEVDSNWIEITDIDICAQKVTGDFQATFLLEEDLGGSGLPDTVMITSSGFEVGFCNACP